jgi:hypothetical protein
MPRLLLPLALLFVLAVPAASAQAPAPSFGLSFSPDKANRSTTGTLVVKDLPPEAAGTPKVDRVVLSMQPGFKADPKGAPGRCTEAQAQDIKCPDSARIGKGTAVLQATFGVNTIDYTAAVEVFIKEKTEPGNLAALTMEIREPQTNTNVVAPGRVLKVGREGGLELRFEGLAKAIPPLPPGVSIRLKSFTTAIGRKRTVTRTIRTKSGRRKRVKVTYSVVRTPKSCPAAWTATLALIRENGAEELQPLSAPCIP